MLILLSFSSSIWKNNKKVKIPKFGTFTLRYKKSRIGRNPKIYYVDQKEAIDIDEEIDFKFAKLIAEKE